MQKNQRRYWVPRIRTAWNKQVASIIETGQLLIEAKQALGFGNWVKMFSAHPLLPQNENRVPFGERTAEMLMEIARHPILSNPKFASDLPPSWATLYELTALPHDLLENFINTQVVHPELKRSKVKHSGGLGEAVLWERGYRALLVLLYFMKLKSPAELAPHIEECNKRKISEEAIHDLQKLSYYLDELRDEILLRREYVLEENDTWVRWGDVAVFDAKGKGLLGSIAPQRRLRFEAYDKYRKHIGTFKKERDAYEAIANGAEAYGALVPPRPKDELPSSSHRARVHDADKQPALQPVSDASNSDASKPIPGNENSE
jgi:hypothetical protein